MLGFGKNKKLLFEKIHPIDEESISIIQLELKLKNGFENGWDIQKIEKEVSNLALNFSDVLLKDIANNINTKYAIGIINTINSFLKQMNKEENMQLREKNLVRLLYFYEINWNEYNIFNGLIGLAFNSCI
ncbi:hypothetical protein MXL46_14110 [Heyndrickxia sporothermodurans]|uniref:hypothetical protein n=1 Tax=Heyndrickxia sporothermodurans TaxID=46224 RepID=UPI002DBBFFF1|nr:hypothetical protein [Heyndrickxia sporothermodurans]MEB6550226.1 hypothetical protein [Heyndrickxia sporothermodurans]